MDSASHLALVHPLEPSWDTGLPGHLTGLWAASPADWTLSWLPDRSAEDPPPQLDTFRKKKQKLKRFQEKVEFGLEDKSYLQNQLPKSKKNFTFSILFQKNIAKVTVFLFCVS